MCLFIHLSLKNNFLVLINTFVNKHSFSKGYKNEADEIEVNKTKFGLQETNVANQQTYR